MDHYVTTTQLKQELRRVKELADTGIVHVLEHGRSAYVLCSRDVYEQQLAGVRSRAIWTVGVTDAARQSEMDAKLRRVCDVEMLVGHGVSLARSVRVAESAARVLSEMLDASSREVFALAMGEVSQFPDAGLVVEYDGDMQGLRKTLVPPYDVLYTVEYDGSVFVRGIVPTVDSL